jgi:uncharacterized protein YdaU (DUF1376 family)
MIHFYVTDIAHWDHDTKYLTFEQKGIYIELCHYYLSSMCSPIPTDLSRVAKSIAPSIVPCRSKLKIQEVLDKTFVITEDGYISQRLLSVLKKSKNYQN